MGFSEFNNHASGALLQRSLERGRLGHAYLFTGDQLDTLERLARVLAKTLNCENPPSRGAGGVATDCCDRCLSCRKVEEDNHADVRWVRPESKTRVITIDQMREIMQAVSLKAGERAWKVAVIVAADRLNVQAANAFLKTLEEPPPRSTLILLSRDPQKLLETILSRCLRVHLAGTGASRESGAHQEWLAGFARRVADTKAGILERYRLLGQLLSKLAEMKASIEAAMTKRSPLETHEDIDARLRERWEDELSAAVEAEYRRQRGELLESLQGWLRDVWLFTLGNGADRWFHPTLQVATGEVGSRISTRDAQHNLTVIEETQRLLGTNLQEALTLEVGLLKLRL